MILIFGLGGYPKGSGTAAALYFAKRGERVVVTDLKPAQQLHQSTLRQLRRFKNVTLVLGRHRRQNIERADVIVCNPGVPDDSPYMRLARQRHKPITNDVGIFLQALREKFSAQAVPVIAVTGTRGKSTTTALIGHILQQHFRKRAKVHVGGNIGVSPLLFFDRIAAGDVVVLEMSSWLLRDVARPAFHIAVVTNLLPDHLNYYSSLTAYQKDKERIFLRQTHTDFAVLNPSDARVRRMAKKTAAAVRWFQPKQIAGSTLRGEHNQNNIGAAWEVAKLLQVPERTIRTAIRSFQPLPNRLEEVRRYCGRLFINDTTATTPDATIAALRSFPRQVILIAGGNSKQLPLHTLHRSIQRRVKHLILLPGNATKQFPKGLAAPTMAQAVNMAWSLSQAGDVILLSPGVTWLPFMNEFERGRQFVQAVRRLC